MSWREEAKCRGMDVNIFHPQKGKSYIVEEKILNVCVPCPVREQCLEDALNDYLQIGYRAGISAKQRSRMVKERSQKGLVPWKSRS